MSGNNCFFKSDSLQIKKYEQLKMLNIFRDDQTSVFPFWVPIRVSAWDVKGLRYTGKLARG